MFVQMVSSQLQLLCYQTWCGDTASWARVSKWVKILLLISSRSRSQCGLIWSKYDSFYYAFGTVDSLATKLGLMIHHHKLECPMKKNGLVHSRSKAHQRVKISMFVQLISSKPLNIFFPNLVLWCIIMSQSVISKRLVCYFQGQGHNKGSYDQNRTISAVSSELLIFSLPNLVWKYSIISQSVLWKNWIVVLKIKVAAKF